jgi:hypothetical protein
MQSTSDQRILALLAPSLASVPPIFRYPEMGGEDHARHLVKLQQLRGQIYLEDGAIEPWQLRADGRHCVDADESSWHVIALSGKAITGCARLQVHSAAVNFSELGVAKAAQARCPAWGDKLRSAVKMELARAEREHLGFVEAGGWAISPALRATTEALRIALGSFALGELLGGCLGLSTATVRHNSSTILRRMGANHLIWNGQRLPPYYDPAYRCEMEVVTFDSRRPSPKFERMMEQLKDELMFAPVYCDVRRPSEVSTDLPALAGSLRLAEETRVSLQPHAS